MTPHLLTTYEPGLGRYVNLGKIDLDNNRHWAMMYDYDPTRDLLLVGHALAVAPCVILHMQQEGVTLLHYRNKRDGYVLEARLETVLKYGQAIKFSGRGTTYIHLAIGPREVLPNGYVMRGKWREKPVYGRQYIKGPVVELPWLDKLPGIGQQVEQLSMAI